MYLKIYQPSTRQHINLELKPRLMDILQILLPIHKFIQKQWRKDNSHVAYNQHQPKRQQRGQFNGRTHLTHQVSVYLLNRRSTITTHLLTSHPDPYSEGSTSRSVATLNHREGGSLSSVIEGSRIRTKQYLLILDCSIRQ